MGGVCLWEVSTYERCPFTGGFKCRVLVEKLLGPQFGVHLWEVSAYGRCPLMRGVHLQEVSNVEF